MVAPSEFTEKVEDDSHRKILYIPYLRQKNGQFELFYLLNKLGLSLESAEEITRQFRQDSSFINDLKSLVKKNAKYKLIGGIKFYPEVSKTSYYGIKYQDLEDNYHLLKGYYSYYDSGSIGEGGDLDNYEKADFYRFFQNRIGDLEKPKTFFNGELIILECQFGGY